MDLDEYQKAAHETTRTADVEIFTLGLFGEAGSVASAIKKLKRDNDAAEVVRDEIKTELGDLLWYLAEIATNYQIPLSEIAQANLEKTRFLFSGSHSFYDEGAPAEQQLPRFGQYEFVDEEGKIKIIFEGRKFGDPLDDNAYIDDGYRFHDVFHLAYMTKLGWSPVTRTLLKRKRKYDEEIDRVEDGARAVFLEEGISVFVFNQNRQTNDGVSSFADRRNIPFSTISIIKEITKTLEVRTRDATAWRDAIAIGFSMFDRLVASNGGTVTCDLVAKTMAFEAPRVES
jgi:NTP pyrophosphatase (non-canonical NTP hydrolase)